MKAIEQSHSERKPKGFWVAHFDQFKTSGLTMSEYIRKNNLVSSQFSYWYYKLKKEINNKIPLSDPSHFIPVKIIENISKETRHQLAPEILGTVEMGGNKHLHLYTESAVESVIKLLLR